MMIDRVALITGGGQGIGAATAKRFARAGATVIIADIAEEPADKVVKDIILDNGKAESAVVDVTDKAQVTELVEGIMAKHNRLDILINNAGITRDGLALKMKEEDWDRVIEVNLRGTWIPSQAVLRPMRKRKWGRIVNTASVAVLGNIGQANYSASKGAVISLTRTLALELGRSGITVNCVAPGTIMTEMFEKIPQKMRDRFIEQIPLRRFGTPEDVAELHLFLCSDAASYITGQTIFVDGGISVGM